MSTELENAIELTLTLEEARSFNEDENGEIMDKLANVIDEAQAQVHMGNTKVAYVIVKIIG